ncbi:MAG: Uma2 family endonuclease [Ktedonobacteraceae bacterium]
MVVDPLFDEESISMHGVPMSAEAFERLIGIESPYRYELIDGVVYDMTGSSPKHSVISSRIEYLLAEQLGWNGPCRVHHDQYVAIPGKPPVVPDVVVTCDLADWDEDKRLTPFKIQSPLIAIEVLSPSTEKYDRTEKFKRYKRCLTLEVYMLVSQSEQKVEIYRKTQGWQQENFTANQIIKLDQHNLELPLAAIYKGIL